MIVAGLRHDGSHERIGRNAARGRCPEGRRRRRSDRMRARVWRHVLGLAPDVLDELLGLDAPQVGESPLLQELGQELVQRLAARQKGGRRLLGLLLGLGSGRLQERQGRVQRRLTRELLEPVPVLLHLLLQVDRFLVRVQELLTRLAVDGLPAQVVLGQALVARYQRLALLLQGCDLQGAGAVGEGREGEGEEGVRVRLLMLGGGAWPSGSRETGKTGKTGRGSLPAAGP